MNTIWCRLLGYEATDAKFIEPGYDYLSVRPDETNKTKRDKSAEGFYFNIIVPQQQYMLKHPEDEEVTGVSTPEQEPAVPDYYPDPDEIPAQ